MTLKTVETGLISDVSFEEEVVDENSSQASSYIETSVADDDEEEGELLDLSVPPIGKQGKEESKGGTRCDSHDGTISQVSSYFEVTVDDNDEVVGEQLDLSVPPIGKQGSESKGGTRCDSNDSGFDLLVPPRTLNREVSGLTEYMPSPPPIRSRKIPQSSPSLGRLRKEVEGKDSGFDLVVPIYSRQMSTLTMLEFETGSATGGSFPQHELDGADAKQKWLGNTTSMLEDLSEDDISLGSDGSQSHSPPVSSKAPATTAPPSESSVASSSATPIAPFTMNAVESLPGKKKGEEVLYQTDEEISFASTNSSDIEYASDDEEEEKSSKKELSLVRRKLKSPERKSKPPKPPSILRNHVFLTV